MARYDPRNHRHRDRYLNAHFGPRGRPKVPFVSHEAAQDYLDHRGVDGEIYVCSVCGKYHVGHLKQKTTEETGET